MAIPGSRACRKIWKKPQVYSDRQKPGRDTVPFTADFYGFDGSVDGADPFQAKTYAIKFYDGGYYYISAVIISGHPF